MESLAHVQHVLQQGLAAAGAAGGDSARDDLLEEVGTLAAGLLDVLEEHSSPRVEGDGDWSDNRHKSPLGSLMDVRRDSSPVLEMGMEVEEAIAAMERDAVREQLYTRFPFTNESVNNDSSAWSLLSQATLTVQCPTGEWARLLLPLERTLFLCELLQLLVTRLTAIPCIYDAVSRGSVLEGAGASIGEEASLTLLSLCERCADGAENFRTTTVAALKLLVGSGYESGVSFTSELVHKLAVGWREDIVFSAMDEIRLNPFFSAGIGALPRIGSIVSVAYNIEENWDDEEEVKCWLSRLEEDLGEKASTAELSTQAGRRAVLELACAALDVDEDSHTREVFEGISERSDIATELSRSGKAIFKALECGKELMREWEEAVSCVASQRTTQVSLWDDSEPLVCDEAPTKEAKDLAASLKAAGTKAFQSKDFEEAVRQYQQSLAALRDPVIFVNMAACFLKMDEPEECISCCKEFLRIHWRHELFGDEEKRRLLTCKAFFRWASALFDLDCPMEAVRALDLSLAHCPAQKLYNSLQSDYRTMLLASLENHGLTGGFGWVPPTVWSNVPCALRSATWCGVADQPLSLCGISDRSELRLLFCEAHQLSSLVSLMRTVQAARENCSSNELMVDCSVPNALAAARLIVLLALAADTSFSGSQSYSFSDLTELWMLVACERELPVTAGKRLYALLNLLAEEGARSSIYPFLVLSDANVMGIEHSKYVLDSCLELELELVLVSWKSVLFEALSEGSGAVPNVTLYDPVLREPLALADFPVQLFPDALESEIVTRMVELLRPLTAVLPLVYPGLLDLSQVTPLLADGTAGQLYIHIIVGDPQAIVVPPSLYNHMERSPTNASDGDISEEEDSGEQEEHLEAPESGGDTGCTPPPPFHGEDGKGDVSAEEGVGRDNEDGIRNGDDVSGSGATASVMSEEPDIETGDDVAQETEQEQETAPTGTIHGPDVTDGPLCREPLAGSPERTDESTKADDSLVTLDSLASSEATAEPKDEECKEEALESLPTGPQYSGMNVACLVDYIGLLNIQPFLESLLPGSDLALSSLYGRCSSWEALVTKATVDVFQGKISLYEAISGVQIVPDECVALVAPAQKLISVNGVTLSGSPLRVLLRKQPATSWSVEDGLEARSLLLEFLEDVTFAERAPFDAEELRLRLLPSTTPLSFMQLLSAAEASVQEGAAAWPYGCLQAVLQALQKDTSIHLIGLASLCGGFQGGLRLSLASHEEDASDPVLDGSNIRMPSILSQCGQLRAYVATVQYTSQAWRQRCTPSPTSAHHIDGVSLVIQAVMHTDVTSLCKKSGVDLWNFFSGEADGAVIQQIDAGLLLLNSGQAIFRFSEVMIDGDGTGERPQLLLLDLLSCSIVGQLLQPAVIA